MSFERIRRALNPQSAKSENPLTIRDNNPVNQIPIKKSSHLDNAIVCCLQGGMGNQMFQYAMAKQIALKLNVPLYLNINRFNLCNMRQYSLGLWEGVKEEITTEEQNRIIENGLPFNERLANSVKPGNTLIGYWQTERYFKGIKPLLQEIFVPKKELTEKGKDTLAKIKEAGDRSVFLTIRRTDYVTNDFHGVLSRKYYDNALSIIAREVKDPVVFIFSDEPEWCEEHMQLGYESYVAGNYDMTTKTHLGREDEELHLMINCKHAVLANSSYSWWGAWLNPNPGIRVAPVKWFNSEKEDPRDIVPEGWIRL